MVDKVIAPVFERRIGQSQPPILGGTIRAHQQAGVGFPAANSRIGIRQKHLGIIHRALVDAVWKYRDFQKADKVMRCQNQSPVRDLMGWNFVAEMLTHPIGLRIKMILDADIVAGSHVRADKSGEGLPVMFVAVKRHVVVLDAGAVIRVAIVNCNLRRNQPDAGKVYWCIHRHFKVAEERIVEINLDEMAAFIRKLI